LLADPRLRHSVGDANQKKAFATYDQSAMFGAYAGLYGIATH
jgi:hypothetical protein